MLDLGLSKMALIGVVALVVLGPERLPRVARTAGALFGRAQRYINDVKAEVSREIELDALRTMKTDFEQAARNVENTIHDNLREHERDLNAAWNTAETPGGSAAAAAPDGVDGGFANVGGAVLDATLARMNPFGRIAMCGMIAAYDGAPAPLANPALILRERLLVQGFIVSEHFDVWPEALAQLASLVANRQLHYRETIAQGLERAPDALLGLLKGRNFGKQLVALV